MSWGHATSTDLLHWTRKARPALVPDRPYDACGVFTGCFATFEPKTSQQLGVIYSSVRELPFHWSTPPYPRNAAGLALATSKDGGKTWEKSPNNPILLGEPGAVSVTGFRDPYMARWPAADRLLRKNDEAVYGLVSGGIQGAGPTSFLYEIQPGDPAKWRYLGPLVEMPSSFQPSKKWSGNFGVNWECVNFLSFQSGPVSKHFLIIGAEGDAERDHIRAYDLPVGLPPRTVRAQLWMSGDLSEHEGSLRFQYRYGGFLDHGSYYAANSFQDPRSGRRIVYGWIPEEDISAARAREKGWNGSLALPRELFLLTIPAVVRALKSPLSEISCLEAEARPDGTFKVNMLGVRPISEVDRLRGSCGNIFHTDDRLLLPRSDSEQRQWLYSTTSPTWELEATISLKAHCDSVGFVVRHNDDISNCTKITFSALDERIIVDRAASNDASDVNKCAMSGPFTLFTTAQSVHRECNGPIWEQEALQLKVFSDGDVLEVFANDRFALATMVYSECQNGACGGITAFATGETGSAVFEKVSIWDDLNGGDSLFQDELD